MTTDPNKPMTAEQVEVMATLQFHLSRFRFLLNPLEGSHQLVDNSILSYLDSLITLDTDTMTKAGRTLDSAVQKLLQAEWDDIQKTVTK